MSGLSILGIVSDSSCCWKKSEQSAVDVLLDRPEQLAVDGIGRFWTEYRFEHGGIIVRSGNEQLSLACAMLSACVLAMQQDLETMEQSMCRRLR